MVNINEGLIESQSDHKLAANTLSLPEVVAQSIGTVAPSGTPALIVPVVFAAAGNGTWLVYLFATIALLCLSWNINQFARRTATAGSLYIFVGQGLGQLFGVIAGWSLLVAYLFTAAAVISGCTSAVLALVHSTHFGHGALAFPISLSFLAIFAVWALAYRDIRLSTRTTLFIELVVIALILLILIAAIIVIGPVVDRQQFSLVGTGADQLRLGLVLAFFSFVGFESATTLGVEAKDPYRAIPRAVTISVVTIGLLFTACAYMFRSSVNTN